MRFARIIYMKNFLFTLAMVLTMVLGTIPYSMADSDSDMNDQMLVKMQNNYAEYLSRENRDLPFTLQSQDKDGEIRASVRTFISNIEFSQFTDRLSNVSQWCEFIPLHLNIKACGYSTDNDQLRLDFFVGAKGYMTPDEAQILAFRVNVLEHPNLFEMGFTASKGPFGSSNYWLDFRAIAVDHGVYLEFDLSSRPGFISSLAKIYFATVGSGKVGFSTLGKDRSGRVRYVKGQRAGAERNIVRYLLSIKTYFETIQWEDQPDIYERRLNYWFDRTEQHKRQLNEMNKEVYMDIKLRERGNQLQLIDSINNNFVPGLNTDSQ